MHLTSTGVSDGTIWTACVAGTALKPIEIEGPQTVTFHFYTPHAFTHQRSQLSKDMHHANEACAYPAGAVDRAFLERALEPAFAWMGAHPDRTLWCGEFGTIRHADRASRQAWMRDVVSIFDAHGIPYCVWNYLTPPNDANRFSLVDDDTRRPLCEWGK